MKVCRAEVRVDGRLFRTARLADEGYDRVADPGPLVEGLRRCRARIDLFTFVQDVPETTPRHRYFMEWDNVAAMAVSTFDHWWARQVNDKVRNLVRRAQKAGVTVRTVPFDDALVEGIAAIYNETPTRRGRGFWHYGKSLETIRRENATFLERSVFLGAFHREELIGFAKLVLGRSDARLMQILAMVRHRDRAPSNALIAEAVRACADRRIAYLVYAKFSYGTKPPDGLTNFKRHNGFERMDLPRYYVPLSLAGRLALKLGLHRDIAAYLPEAALVQFRRARRLWSGPLHGVKEGA